MSILDDFWNNGHKKCKSCRVIHNRRRIRKRGRYLGMCARDKVRQDV